MSVLSHVFFEGGGEGQNFLGLSFPDFGGWGEFLGLSFPDLGGLRSEFLKHPCMDRIARQKHKSTFGR